MSNTQLSSSLYFDLTRLSFQSVGGNQLAKQEGLYQTRTIATGFKERRKRDAIAWPNTRNGITRGQRKVSGFKRVVTPCFPRRGMPFLVAKNGTSTTRSTCTSESRRQVHYVYTCIFCRGSNGNKFINMYLLLELFKLLLIYSL